MNIYIFNPDSDLALSERGANYLPPANIRRMSEDLSLLPIWYAQPESAVFLPPGMKEERIQAANKHLAQMKELFGMKIHIASEVDLATAKAIIPWGWNKTIRRRLMLQGINEQLLPTHEKLEMHRIACSRTYTAEILTHFRTMKVPQVEGEAHVINHPDALRHNDNPFLLKSLWSGSGKGLYWCRQGLSPDATDWMTRQLKRDGAIMMEPIYNKVYDFAMEFLADGKGKVTFAGYSRFLTNEKGAYTSNLLIPDIEIERWLAQFIPIGTIHTVCQTLCQLLSASHGETYQGYLGVDMMLYQPKKTGHSSASASEYPAKLLYLHPCVEINFRMNMGMAAHAFCQNYLATGVHATFLIENHPTPESLYCRHKTDQCLHPLRVENHRLISGYLPLTPISSESTYRAAVIVDE